MLYYTPLLVQRLGSLMQTTGKTIVDEGRLEDTLKGGHDIHRASSLDGCGCGAANKKYANEL